jgi:hypothetical protein
MKIFILDTYYTSFLHTFYASHPGMARRPYQEQWQALMDECFGVADSYPRNLKKLGHEAVEVVTNNDLLQRQWARENGISVGWLLPVIRSLPLLHRLLTGQQQKNLPSQIVLAQIEAFKPDVLYVLSLGAIDNSTLRAVKPKIRLIVGQGAADYKIDELYKHLTYYDLFLSSYPHFVSRMRELGKRSEYFKLGFGEQVLSYIPPVSNRNINISFVGGLGPRWGNSIEVFEKVARKFDFQVWSPSIDSLPVDSAIRKCYQGHAYGLDTYRIYARSKIVLNRHINAAENYANNSRLYEATGMGALLVTEMKDNLPELFEPEKEVVTYRSADEAVEKIQYYLEHEDERAAIAKAGQERTLREHTYYHCMQELCQIISRYI